MKNFSTLLIALAVAATASLAAAQGTSTAPAATEKKADAKGTEAKTDKKMTAKSVSGTVKSAGADSLVVTGKDKGKDVEWTFGVDAKTSIKKGGKTAAVTDLKAGDPVQVRFVEQDGKSVAQAVTAKAGGTDKAAADPSKKADAMAKKDAAKAAEPAKK